MTTHFRTPSVSARSSSDARASSGLSSPAKIALGAGAVLLLLAGAWALWPSEPDSRTPALAAFEGRTATEVPDEDPPVIVETPPTIEILPSAPATLAAADAAAVENAYAGKEMLPFAKLDERWSKEEKNREWTANWTNYIYALLEPEEMETGFLHDVDCRETLCKVVLGPENPRALTHLGMTMKNAGYKFAVGAVPLDGGGRITPVFVARDGHDGTLYGMEE